MSASSHHSQKIAAIDADLALREIAQRLAELPTLAQYLTVGGATVDITEHPDEHEAATTANCTGCAASRAAAWDIAYFTGSPDSRYPQTPSVARSDARRHAEHQAREWAQDHASICRAMPRPEATG